MKKSAPITRRSQAYYGWIPDLPDKRDITYRSIFKVPRKLPARMDLRGGCSAVEDQGRIGSCTANALVGLLEYLERQAIPSQLPVDLSRLFLYYNARVIIDEAKNDSGAYLRDGIKSLAKQGICPEAIWPYNIAQFTSKPSPACYASARKHLIGSYQRLYGLDEMRACLADGYPFVFGFTVYEGFESEKVRKTGVLNLPKSSESQKGGHAVCAVGYDDKTKRFLVRNSWGKGWGQQGYFTMPYAYLDDRNLSDDFWTIRKFTQPTASAKAAR